ncbi:MAG: glycosyltransferase [Chitinophagales bacterium]|nr:glycosyltransferase [Chitinophagales bacterium]
MTISVVITVYNLEKYIETALQSVFQQTLQADEIIVVDDGSTDRSAAIIEQHLARIRYIKMPQNSGVLSAFLTGIEASTGEILSFLDGDDAWYPTKLAEIAQTFSISSKIMMVTHNYECMNGNGDTIPYHNDQTYLNTQNIYRQTKGNWQAMSDRLKNAILCYKGVWQGSAFCIRKAALNLPALHHFIDSISFPDFRKLSHQDQLLSAFLILYPNNKDKWIVYIDKILFRYRIFDNNSSGVSGSLESAKKTIRRTIATCTGTYTLVAQQPEGTFIEEKQQQELLLNQARYICALYDRQWINVGQLYGQLFRKWSHSIRFKETFRLIGFLLLGKYFFQLKQYV